MKHGKIVALQKGCKALLPEIETRIKAQAQWLAEVCEHQGDLTLSSSMKLRTHVPLAQGLHILSTCLLFPKVLTFDTSASCSAFLRTF